MGSAESSSHEEHHRNSSSNNKDTLISLDLNVKQLWERLHGHLDSLHSVYPLRHGSSASRQHPQPSQSAAAFFGSRHLRDLITRCMDIVESQQQALATKDAQIAELQELLSAAQANVGKKSVGQAGGGGRQPRPVAAASRRRRQPNSELASLTAPSIHDEAPRRVHAPAAVVAAPQLPQLLQQQPPPPTTSPSTPPPQQQQPASATADAEDASAPSARKRTRLAAAGSGAASTTAAVPSDSANAGQSPTAIETPAWRIIGTPAKAAYKLEGTEDLSDKHYEALHTRQEADERRRKLWDMRAQRERAYYDRLRQKASQRAEAVAAAAAADAAAAAVDSSGQASDKQQLAPEQPFRELEDRTRLRLVGKPMPDFNDRLAQLLSGAAGSDVLAAASASDGLVVSRGGRRLKRDA